MSRALPRLSKRLDALRAPALVVKLTGSEGSAVALKLLPSLSCSRSAVSVTAVPGRTLSCIGHWHSVGLSHPSAHRAAA